MADRHAEENLPTVSRVELTGANRSETVPCIHGFNSFQEIGRGGMSVVYRAQDLNLDRWVAVKGLKGDVVPDELAFLQREARLAARLNHPNIVRVYGFYPEIKPPCLIMELVDGIPLDAAVGDADYRRKATLLSRVCRAVQYAHDQGILHRDLKPQNILVDSAGEPRILDFGVARRWRTDGPGEGGSVYGGTPLYMAPELFRDRDENSPRTDVYALGIILHELLTGKSPPLPSPEERNDPNAWAARPILLPREQAPDVPESLQRICLKACEQNPEDRYPTARQLGDDLDRFLAGQSVWARPNAYRRLLSVRVQMHLEDVELWKSEGLVDSRECDNLSSPYMDLLARDQIGVPDGRRMQWAPVVSYLGGWLMVVSVMLWLIIYWGDLSRWQRVAGVGVPAVLVNLLGWLMMKHQSRLLGTILLGIGILLAPVFLVVLFSEFDIFEWRQRDEYELLSPRLFCNSQLLLAALFMAAHTGILTWRTRLGLFSSLSTAAGLFVYAACLLLAGLKTELTHEHFASLAAWFWPLIVLAWLAASILDRGKRETLAAPAYVLAAVGCLGILGTWAIDAPKSWLGIRDIDWLTLWRYVFLVGTSLVCFVLAYLNDRSWSRLRRMWGRWFYRLAPPLLVIPLDLMDNPLRHLQIQSMVAFTLENTQGPAQVYLTKLLVFAACLIFVGLSVALQWRWYLYYGLIHLSVSLVLFTDIYLREYVWWPLAILAIGAVTIALGVAMELLRKWIALRRATAIRTT